MKKSVAVLLLCFAAMGQLPDQCLAADPPAADKDLAGPDGQVIQVINEPIQVRPRQPGAYENAIVNLDIDKVSSAALRVTLYDIDALEEVVMTVNGTKIALPSEVVADMQDRTVTVALPTSVLKQGDNEIGFLFAEAVGGTSGFAIFDLQVVLHRQ